MKRDTRHPLFLRTVARGVRFTRPLSYSKGHRFSQTERKFQLPTLHFERLQIIFRSFIRHTVDVPTRCVPFKV